MGDPVPVPDQFGSRHRIARIGNLALARQRALHLVRQQIQHAAGFPVGAAVGQLLNPVGQPAFKEAAAVVRGRGPKERLPFGLQVVDRHGLQRRQSRQDRFVRRHADLL
jgi:hypothetical protein